MRTPICSVCRETGHNPNNYPKIMDEDADLTISASNIILSGDHMEGMCEYDESGHVLDAFFTNSGGGFSTDCNPGINIRID